MKQILQSMCNFEEDRVALILRKGNNDFDFCNISGYIVNTIYEDGNFVSTKTMFIDQRSVVNESIKCVKTYIPKNITLEKLVGLLDKKLDYFGNICMDKARIVETEVEGYGLSDICEELKDLDVDIKFSNEKLRDKELILKYRLSIWEDGDRIFVEVSNKDSTCIGNFIYTQFTYDDYDLFDVITDIVTFISNKLASERKYFKGEYDIKVVECEIDEGITKKHEVDKKSLEYKIIDAINVKVGK